jgi:predicted unusual protein kinase regulating ubiquinone biosynthesis (AarF/ABC1/UbiB family)
VSGHLPKNILDEMESQILAETDYVREAAEIEFFKTRLAPLPFVQVPEVLGSHSSDRVLTMSVVRGRHIDEFMSTRPSQAVRDLLGRRLLELFLFQLLRLERLHADPHWGNYLFNEDGSIGLVDFGCVKHFDRNHVASLRKGFLYSGDFRGAEFQQIVQEQFAVGNKKVSPATRRAVVEFAERFYRKVFPPRDAARLFDFSDSGFLRDFMRAALKLTRAKGTPAHFVFFARAEIGLYMTLHRLRARVPTTAIVRRLLDATHGGESRGRP